ncbi:MAG TPA: hypothetical protein VHS06_12565 [Chloroflexota bacterium]|nr:hypothetical protein [Chloroflexota bacterium]HEX2988985.1 hypothetical protein [Chloroflexota bacterium]
MSEEKKTEGVKVHKTGKKSWEHKYDLSDMQAVYRRGHWNSWDEIIGWLKAHGEGDNELTPGETAAIVEDLQGVRDARVPFTNDPRKAYDLVFEHGVGTRKKKAA